MLHDYLYCCVVARTADVILSDGYRLVVVLCDSCTCFLVLDMAQHGTFIFIYINLYFVWLLQRAKEVGGADFTGEHTEAAT